VGELAVGEARACAGERAVVDQRERRSAASLDVAVEGVPAGVGDAALEPLGAAEAIGRQHAVGRRDPVERARGLAPETFRIGQRPAMDLGVSAQRGVSPCGGTYTLLR